MICRRSRKASAAVCQQSSSSREAEFFADQRGLCQGCRLLNEATTLASEGRQSSQSFHKVPSWGTSLSHERVAVLSAGGHDSGRDQAVLLLRRRQEGDEKLSESPASFF